MDKLIKVVFSFLLIIFPTSISERAYKGSFFDGVKFKSSMGEINGTFEKGENLSILFEKFGFSKEDLERASSTIKKYFNLKSFKAGRKYKFIWEKENLLKEFHYWIDDENILKLKKEGEKFFCKKEKIFYDKKLIYLKGTIEENLIFALREDVNVALELSEIFSSDIDFYTDLRPGDSFEILIEGLFINNFFKKYGKVVYARFLNKGKEYYAFIFKDEKGFSYYDERGRSKFKSFLRSPLNFKRISSTFTHKRYHPILKILRPHYGIDYVAPYETPVSAIGEGEVVFAGYKGEYGNLIVIKHNNGWKTLYGHLSNLSKNLKRGKRVSQGEVIGYVGSTGLSAGPHLHFELRIGERAVNPFKLKIPEGKEIKKEKINEFNGFQKKIREILSKVNLNKNKIILEDLKWELN